LPAPYLNSTYLIFMNFNFGIVLYYGLGIPLGLTLDMIIYIWLYVYISINIRYKILPILKDIDYIGIVLKYPYVILRIILFLSIASGKNLEHQTAILDYNIETPYILNSSGHNPSIADLLNPSSTGNPVKNAGGPNMNPNRFQGLGFFTKDARDNIVDKLLWQSDQNRQLGGNLRSIYDPIYSHEATLTEVEQRLLAREVLADSYDGKYFVKSSGKIGTRFASRPDALDSLCPLVTPTQEFIHYVQSRNQRDF
jgi:hypothetical protein